MRKTITVLDNELVPTVVMSGQAAVVLKYNQDLSIRAFGTVPVCPNSNEIYALTYFWKVYKGSEYDPSITNTATDLKNFKLPAKTLDPSTLYYVQVIVYIAGMDAKFTASSIKAVQVIPSGLKAIITGGSDRTVSATFKKHVQVIDGSLSYDLDQGTPEASSLVYAWECIETSSNYYGEPCKLGQPDGTIALTNETSSILMANLSYYGHMFNTTRSLLVSLHVSNTAGLIDSSSTDLTVVSGADMPSIGIVGEVQTKYNANSRITIDALVVADYTVNVEWGIHLLTSATLLDTSTFILPTLSTFGAGSSSFQQAIASNALTPGATYTLSLRATYPVYAEYGGRSAVHLVINKPPAGGGLQVTPKTGTSLETIFVFQAYGWVDDADDYPLSYAMSYATVPDLPPNLIKTISELTFASTKLGSGLVSLDYSLECRVTVYDIYDGSARSLNYVQSLPMTFATDGRRLQATDQTITASFTEALMEGVITSDAVLITQVIDGFTSTINAVNCSLASNAYCTSLNRQVCSAKTHTCGICLTGYYSIENDGDSNVPCISTVDTLLNIDDVCTTDNECFTHKCTASVCTDQSKTCTNDCSGAGSCAFKDFNDLDLDSCVAGNFSCTAYCRCNEGKYGDDCHLLSSDFHSYESIRATMCDSVWDATFMQDLSEDAITSRVGTLQRILFDGTQVTSTAMFSCAKSILKTVDQYVELGAVNSDVVDSLVTLTAYMLDTPHTLDLIDNDFIQYDLMDAYIALSDLLQANLLAGEAMAAFTTNTINLGIVKVTSDADLVVPYSSWDQRADVFPLSIASVKLTESIGSANLSGTDYYGFTVIQSSTNLLKTGSRLLEKPASTADLGIRWKKFSDASSLSLEVTMYNFKEIEYFRSPHVDIIFQCVRLGIPYTHHLTCMYGNHTPGPQNLNLTYDCPGTYGRVVNYTCPIFRREATCAGWNGTAYNKDDTCYTTTYNARNTTCVCARGVHNVSTDYSTSSNHPSANQSASTNTASSTNLTSMGISMARESSRGRRRLQDSATSTTLATTYEYTYTAAVEFFSVVTVVTRDSYDTGYTAFTDDGKPYPVVFDSVISGTFSCILLLIIVGTFSFWVFDRQSHKESIKGVVRNKRVSKMRSHSDKYDKTSKWMKWYNTAMLQIKPHQRQDGEGVEESIIPLNNNHVRNLYLNNTSHIDMVRLTTGHIRDLMKMDSFFNSILPREFTNIPWYTKYAQKFLEDHEWLSLVMPYRSRDYQQGVSHSEGKLMRFIVFASRLLNFLFFTTVFIQSYYPDDGTCEEQRVEDTCLALKTLLELDNLCTWRPRLNTACEFKQSSLSSALPIVLVASLISCCVLPLDHLVYYLYLKIAFSIKEDRREKGAGSSKVYATIANDSSTPTPEKPKPEPKVTGRRLLSQRFNELRRCQSLRGTVLRAARLKLMNSTMDKLSSRKEIFGLLNEMHKDPCLKISDTTPRTFQSQIMRQAKMAVRAVWNSGLFVAGGGCGFMDAYRIEPVYFRDHLDESIIDYVSAEVKYGRKKGKAYKRMLRSFEGEYDQEAFLAQAFIIESLPEFKRNIARHYLFRKADITRDIITYDGWFNSDTIIHIILACTVGYAIFAVIYIYHYGQTVGTRAVNSWMAIWLLSIGLDVVVMQPAKIFFKWVTITAFVADEIKLHHGMLKLRARHLLMRTAGLLRVGLVQHTNPACRAARAHAELPIARLLMSLNDSDMPVDKWRQTRMEQNKDKKRMKRRAKRKGILHDKWAYYDEIKEHTWTTVYAILTPILFLIFLLPHTLSQSMIDAMIVLFVAFVLCSLIAAASVSLAIPIVISLILLVGVGCALHFAAFKSKTAKVGLVGSGSLVRPPTPYDYKEFKYSDTSRPRLSSVGSMDSMDSLSSLRSTKGGVGVVKPTDTLVPFDVLLSADPHPTDGSDGSQNRLQIEMPVDAHIRPAPPMGIHAIPDVDGDDEHELGEFDIFLGYKYKLNGRKRCITLAEKRELQLAVYEHKIGRVIFPLSHRFGIATDTATLPGTPPESEDESEKEAELEREEEERRKREEEDAEAEAVEEEARRQKEEEEKYEEEESQALPIEEEEPLQPGRDEIKGSDGTTWKVPMALVKARDRLRKAQEARIQSAVDNDVSLDFTSLYEHPEQKRQVERQRDLMVARQGPLLGDIKMVAVPKDIAAVSTKSVTRPTTKRPAQVPHVVRVKRERER